jgi:4-hydroxy-3-polyprenylbenzoate decarboxylase
VTLDSLSAFIAALDEAGELVRITHPVNANLELCEIADRVMKQPGAGKALLFENVIRHDGTRSPWPVAINLFGSMRRMSMALGVENLIIVHTSDATLVADKREEQSVKKLIEELKRRGMEGYI